MAERLGLFCIGHRPPEFQPPHPFVHVSPVPSPCPQALLIPDDSLGERWDGRILSEYTQLFGLAESGALADLEAVYIFQYRKFLALTPGPRVATNIPYAHAASAAEAEALFPAPAELGRLGSALLIGPALRIRSLAHQYARHHLVEDFAAFAAALAMLPAFEPQRLARFIAGGVLLPAPSLGLVPVALLLDQLRTLRQAWQMFAAHYYVPREGYQRRVGGFLLERLHSFLLVEAISAGAVQAARGHQIIVSTTPEIQPTL